MAPKNWHDSSTRVQGGNWSCLRGMSGCHVVGFVKYIALPFLAVFSTCTKLTHQTYKYYQSDLNDLWAFHGVPLYGPPQVHNQLWKCIKSILQLTSLKSSNFNLGFCCVGASIIWRCWYLKKLEKLPVLVQTPCFGWYQGEVIGQEINSLSILSFFVRDVIRPCASVKNGWVQHSPCSKKHDLTATR